ncbi:MAG: CRTAC1 family protein [Chthoniobacterales bacterium]|nr:CRTAC1 family protein [Chthoniobacterales bacterium]
MLYVSNLATVGAPDTSHTMKTSIYYSRRFFPSVLAGVLLVALSSSLCAQQFTDVSTAAGIEHVKTRAWGNPIWGDLNNDGYLDLIVPVHELAYLGGPPTPFVYINNKDGTFHNLGTASGLTGLGNPGVNSPDDKDWLGLSLGDYNGDGILDFFAAEPPFQSGNPGQSNITPDTSTMDTRNALYKGNGDGTFTYTAFAAGLEIGRNYGECGFWVDYNNDGKLDLFVKSQSTNMEASVNVLYKNNGNGTFAKVAGAAGLEMAIGGTTAGSIVSFADYDNDGFMDVVMGGNDAPAALYHNNRDGTFSEVTTTAGLVSRVNANGLAWGDYNNDGLLDLYISRGKQSGMGDLGNTLYHNNGDGTFTDVTAAAGVNDNTNTWAAVWGDYDNDGFLDLYVARAGTTVIGPGNANILYHNNGDGTFTNVAKAQGVAMETDLPGAAHKLAAWGDYNNDGFLDLVVQDGIAPTLQTGDNATGYHFLFKNNGNSNHAIKVNLKGTLSNLNGIGARVTVTYSGSKIAFSENNGGGGGEYASQGAEPLHFGIGAATVASVQVIWPSGVVDTRAAVAAGSTITITEGESGGGTPTPTPTPSATPTPTPTPTPSPTPPSGTLRNISTRVDVQSGNNVAIAGFIVTGGTADKKTLIRVRGPSLTENGLPASELLADPMLELHLPDGTVVSNNNWKARQEAAILQTGYAPTNDLESAIYATLPPLDPSVPGSGVYTAVVTSHDGGTGIALVEVYDVDTEGASLSQLANISTRGFVGTGDNVLIGGFIVGTESSDAPVLMRALGPSLSDIDPNITDALQDPTLELRDANGTLITSNDNWKECGATGCQDAIQNTGLAPTNDKEAAILRDLPAGIYTTIMQGAGSTSGVGLVEVYRLK